jgi:two-component system, LuxR family, sensor kinase FixL
MISFWLTAPRGKTLIATGLLTVLVVVVDSYTTLSFALLYILPVMLGALVMGPRGTLTLALVCGIAQSQFDQSPNRAEQMLHFAFAVLSYSAAGLLVMSLVRNRRAVAGHLAKLQSEHALRENAEEHLRALVASSPAAILTIDERGKVLAANHAANMLFAIPESDTVLGRSIVDYLPILFDAARTEGPGHGFRTSAQCQGYRQNGEMFFAQTWFSSYAGSDGQRVAAIIVDCSDDVRDREEQNLRQLQRSNRITAAAVSHELRNLCGAISLLCTHFRGRLDLPLDDDFLALFSMVDGLKTITSFNLQAQVADTAEATSLRKVLDHLRIVIESEWEEIDGRVVWDLPADLPMILADSHGLLQAFLNLAHNSHRAVLDRSVRELKISARVNHDRVAVHFSDTGPGVPAPDQLFQPLQRGADGSGLGLYVSRAFVRSYGGELRFQPQAPGSCFVVELQTFPEGRSQ